MQAAAAAATTPRIAGTTTTNRGGKAAADTPSLGTPAVATGCSVGNEDANDKEAAGSACRDVDGGYCGLRECYTEQWLSD